MTNITLSATKVIVDFEANEVVLINAELSDIINEVGTEEILNEMSYEDIMAYVTEVERDKAEEDRE